MLLRELSSDDEEPISATTSIPAPADPDKPWRKEFYHYLNTVDELHGLNIVQWWGVSLI